MPNNPILAANVLAVCGLGLLIVAGGMLHPAAGFAIAGGACVAIAIGIVRSMSNDS